MSRNWTVLARGQDPERARSLEASLEAKGLRSERRGDADEWELTVPNNQFRRAHRSLQGGELADLLVEAEPASHDGGGTMQAHLGRFLAPLCVVVFYVLVGLVVVQGMNWIFG